MPTVERPHAPALIGAAANFAQSEGRPEHRSCSPAPEADQLGTRPFYAWKVGLGGGEMGAVVRPARNSGAIGSPTDFRSWMSRCEAGTSVNPVQANSVAIPARSAWTSESGEIGRAAGRVRARSNGDMSSFNE